MTRPSWDRYFLDLAAVVATRSACCRRSVGTVFVRDRHVLSTGFNGVPRGAPHRTLETCVRRDIPSGEQADKVCCAHSEANAIALAAYHGTATKGATAYVTLLPCAGCARLLINAGIVRVVYEHSYPNPDSLPVFAESGIEVEQAPAKPAAPECPDPTFCRDTGCGEQCRPAMLPAATPSRCCGDANGVCSDCPAEAAQDASLVAIGAATLPAAAPANAGALAAFAREDAIMPKPAGCLGCGGEGEGLHAPGCGKWCGACEGKGGWWENSIAHTDRRVSCKACGGSGVVRS